MPFSFSNVSRLGIKIFFVSNILNSFIAGSYCKMEQIKFMAIEIERKYLVKGAGWRGLTKPVHYYQGYLIADKEKTVRVRDCRVNQVS